MAAVGVAPETPMNSARTWANRFSFVTLSKHALDSAAAFCIAAVHGSGFGG
jgi:hypothetical protein